MDNLRLLLVLALPTLSCLALAASPVVRLGKTEVIGTSYKFLGKVEEEFFGGIPYAKPPIHDLRFAPPVEQGSLSISKLDATRFGLPCPQLGVCSGITNGTEDCLKLNILRPAITEEGCDTPLPVLVWIFGGGFKTGFADKFNGSTLVMHSVVRGTPVIYVNLNYRVGPFGFPQGSEAMARGALNLGLKDQLAALTWIKKNIAAFGGDPHKVTVFGSSAGAISIADLYLNPSLENLVHGTISGSGFTSTIALYNATVRETEWTNFVQATPGCADELSNNTFACLRDASIDTLLDAYNTSAAESPESYQFVPVIDGPGGLIPDSPSKLYSDGKFARIPLMTGANLDDGTFFTPAGVSSDAQIEEFLVAAALPFQPPPPPPAVTDVIAEVLQLYPNDPTVGCPFGTGNETFGLSSEYKRLAAIAGDSSFHAPRRAWVRTASGAGVPVYAFLFADEQAVETPRLGVTHGTDVPYFYGTPFLEGPEPAGTLSEAMMDYVIAFVNSLNPNDGKGCERPFWPQFTADGEVLMQLSGTNLTVISDEYRAEQIAFLMSVAAGQSE
ncbi:esterase 1 [Trametes coccinea BRFM310]|uniref:Carboxylic ester hydrolase n=1 Tax=Trametes coccinea (strain BRFM310) TaxID=1353009 RepID=A0A1Y2J130_TRAC3|nr:esterase 1 [Trametes coccinea BRFM310]